MGGHRWNLSWGMITCVALLIGPVRQGQEMASSGTCGRCRSQVHPPSPKVGSNHSPSGLYAKALLVTPAARAAMQGGGRVPCPCGVRNWHTEPPTVHPGPLVVHHSVGESLADLSAQCAALSFVVDEDDVHTAAGRARALGDKASLSCRAGRGTHYLSLARACSTPGNSTLIAAAALLTWMLRVAACTAGVTAQKARHVRVRGCGNRAAPGWTYPSVLPPRLRQLPLPEP